MTIEKPNVPGSCSATYAGRKTVDGKSSKHCLFAGTRVLQAGVGGDIEEELEAVVITSGIHTTKGQLVSKILFPAQMQFKCVLGMLEILIA